VGSCIATKIVAAAGSADVVAAVCSSRKLHLFVLDTGQRMLPALVLDGRAVLLRVVGQYVVVLTSRGLLWMWDVKAMRAVHSRLSLTSVLAAPGNGNLADITIDADGSMMLTMASTKHFAMAVRTYIYHAGLKMWLEIDDVESAVRKASDFHSTLAPLAAPATSNGGGGIAGVGSVSGGGGRSGKRKQPLAVAQRLLCTEMVGSKHAHAKWLKNVPDADVTAATVAHLESVLASARVLGSEDEFVEWHEAYIRALALQGDEGKLRLVFASLLGPPEQSGSTAAGDGGGGGGSSSGGDGGWIAHVHPWVRLGKRTLLGKALAVAAQSNREMQRLVSEFKGDLTEAAE